MDTEVIIEPVRGPLIPGFFAVKQAAKAAGMLHMCTPAVEHGLLHASSNVTLSKPPRQLVRLTHAPLLLSKACCMLLWM